jgi:hypothetical protein
MKPAFLLAIPRTLGMLLFGMLLCGMGTASAAVDPALLALMPPDSSFLFGMQAQNVLASPFGQYAIAQLPANNGMVMFAAATGFDYQRDLQEVVGASNGTGSRARLVLARGSFQPSKFLALAAVAGATITNYNGTQIFAPPKGATSIAFLDSSTLAIGSTESLQAAIDRYTAHKQFSGPLADKAIAASAASDAWFATVTPPSQFMPKSAALPPNVLQQVREISAGVHFTDMGMIATGELTTVSSQQAHMLQGVLQFLSAMAQSNTLPNPNAARAAALISSAQFTVNGTALDVTLPVPEQTLEQMYSARQKPADKASIH